MRGGKDVKKLMDPLFPRLHINDAERGGPRAPPRNKMALCEQVNIPSQRLSSESMSMRPLPSINSTNLVPSAYLSHVRCHENNGFSLFYSSPEPSHMAERFHSDSAGAMILNTKYPEFQILKPGNYQAFSARMPLKLAAECRLFWPCSFYNSMNSSSKKLGNEDDIRIPYFGQREKSVNRGSVGHLEHEKVTSSSLSASGKNRTAFERLEKEIGRTDVKSSEHPRNQVEDNCKVSEMSEDNAETLHPHPSTQDKVLRDAVPSVLAIYRTSESGNRALVPIDHTRGNSLVNNLRALPDTHTQTHKKCTRLPVDTANIDNISRDPERLLRKRTFTAMESPPCSSPQTGENNRTPNRLESVYECPKGNDHASSHVGDVERNIALSNPYVVDSKSGLDISPADVVGVIGPKLFWRVRRTISHQQRIFALQIFELHRLVKVQRLIAGSPEMLFEHNVIFSKPSINFSQEKKLQLDNLPELPAKFLKPKVDCQKPKPCSDIMAGDAHRKLPPSNDAEKGHVAPKSALKPYSEALTFTSFAPDTKSAPWCFHTPPGNQWLAPVRSPSEGLVYKPYTGLCPPTAGSIAPVYGSCGMSLTRADGEYLNTAYGVPTSIQQGIGIYSGPAPLGRSCFQTYALPAINTSNSSSVVEQTSPFATARSSGKDHRLSIYDMNYSIPFQNSCNVSSQRSGIITDSGRHFLASKGGEFQGSTASSPDKRVQGDALSLFPTTPTVQMSQHPIQNHNTERQIQVIKVIPHNPKSASESAARIFQSIQEERKQHE